MDFVLIGKETNIKLHDVLEKRKTHNLMSNEPPITRYRPTRFKVITVKGIDTVQEEPQDENESLGEEESPEDGVGDDIDQSDIMMSEDLRDEPSDSDKDAGDYVPDPNDK
jgi:hypothetical protein